MYTVYNLYKEFIKQQDFVLHKILCFFYIFKWNLLVLQCIYKLQQFTYVPCLEPPLSNSYPKSMCFDRFNFWCFLADLDQGCKQNKSLLTV